MTRQSCIDPMPSLNWIGKNAVSKHHEEVKYCLPRVDRDLSSGEPKTGNFLVQGDNLKALKSLVPFYSESIKCIYIDPPYNTGVDDRDETGNRTGWVYSDNVDSPEIREWLGKVVGAESEDLSRHDKWLCMMYPRLQLLKKLLRRDGVIFVSIDDIEYASLRLLMDEVFGVSNRIGTVIWKNVTDNNPTRIATEHEYVMCYAKRAELVDKEWKSVNLAVKDKLLELGKDFVAKYPDQDERQAAYSKWFKENKDFLWPFDRYKFIDGGGIFTGSQSVHNPGKEGYRYDIIHPDTKKPCDQPLMGYRFPQETANRLLSEGRIIFGKDEKKIIELKLYVKDYRAKLSSLFELDGRIGTNEVKDLFPENNRPFDFPKPTELIEELISFTTSGNDIILDAFAGSGTTGHAVFKLNKADGQRRRFILIEMKEKIAREITRERLHRVIQKMKAPPEDKVGFIYYRLGPEITDETGKINPEVRFLDLAQYVFFSAAGEPLRPKKEKSPLLGFTRDGTAVYLLYNGILGDKSASGGNVLTREVYASLPPHNGPKIIFAEGHRMSASRMEREQIIPKQIPYSIPTK